MKPIAQHLQGVIDHYCSLLKGIPVNEMSARPHPSKWSKQEIVGHLVDSAQNNLRRFIVAQYEETPHIIYQQDDWVRINNYNNWSPADLIDLWCLTNKQIVSVLENTSAELLNRKSRTNSGEHTIEWLAEDYVKHLRHHLHQVLDLEPVPYP